MKHEELCDCLDELRDCEAKEPLKGELAAHLSACPECRQIYAGRSALFARVFSPVAPPSAEQIENFTQAVMKKIPLTLTLSTGQRAGVRDEVEMGRSFLWWAIPSLSFALAALVLALRHGAPSFMIPADSQLLIGGQNRTVATMVLPPDPENSRDLVAFEQEE